MKKADLIKKLLLISFLTFMFRTELYAVDIDYSGRLDEYTGVSDSVPMQSEYRLELSEGVYYDTQEHIFVHRYNQDAHGEIKSNIVSGMITNKVVMIDFVDGVVVNLYKNGEKVTNPDFSNIVEVGNYVLSVNVQGTQTQVMTFTIVGEYASNIKSYNLPKGFIVTEVMVNEKLVDSGEYSVSMTTEGRYYISYKCIKTDIAYELRTTVDSTVPQLTLDGVKGAIAKGPVTILSAEQGNYVRVVLDNKEIPYKEKLTKSGSYKITVWDVAGNTNTYQFKILVYLDTNSFVVFGLIAGIILAVVLYLMIVRKRIRVR